jgi:hypothetical protein
VAEFLERRKYLVLAAITLVFAIGAAGRAAARPFWYDEIITLITARAPSLGAVLAASRVTDANPPLPHLATHLAIRWFGLSEVTARLPAMAGFWLFCLCLFVFVARRKGALIGFSALLLPLATGALVYAAEARAYGMELGLCGLALIAWQAAAEDRARAIALPVLSLAIAGMLLCHYYGALIYLPLGAGELMRARRTRRLDLALAAALALGAAPLVWLALAVLGAVHGSSQTWAAAYLRQGIEFWDTTLAQGAAYFALLLGVLALAGRTGKKQVIDPGGAVPDYEWVAAALFLALPLAAIVAALFVTHMFTPRYAIIGVAGVCLLIPMLAAEFTGTRSRTGVLMATVLAWAALVTLADHGGSADPFAGEPALNAALEQGPVVIADGQLFLQMWHYAPERLKPHILFLTDAAAALRYMGFNTIDSGVIPLRSYSTVQVLDYRTFAAANREFLVYRNLSRPEWVLPRVLDDGASVEVLKAGLFRELVRVRLK